MNRTKIEWTDWTWNPVTGCDRGCWYCYAARIAQRLKGRFGYPEEAPFLPTFHPDRLDEPSKVKKPSKIFVCSMGELFDPFMPSRYIRDVLQVVRNNPQHIFQVLTKRPEVLRYFDYPPNVWLGITVDVKKALDGRRHLKNTNARIKFISFEPLLEAMGKPKLSGIQWIIIGSKTGPKPFMPPYEWVKDLIYAARRDRCAIFLKNNLSSLYGRKIQEFPNQTGPQGGVVGGLGFSSSGGFINP